MTRVMSFHAAFQAAIFTLNSSLGVTAVLLTGPDPSGISVLPMSNHI
jgi:hypothetical protein